MILAAILAQFKPLSGSWKNIHRQEKYATKKKPGFGLLEVIGTGIHLNRIDYSS
jgi:hypothetical protein